MPAAPLRLGLAAGPDPVGNFRSRSPSPRSVRPHRPRSPPRRRGTPPPAPTVIDGAPSTARVDTVGRSLTPAPPRMGLAPACLAMGRASSQPSRRPSRAPLLGPLRRRPICSHANLGHGPQVAGTGKATL
ncbi:laminin subunit beta-1 variant-like [Hordeum vulgare subsp. vulgare]|uniref:laminin subunit beta-1 variant-like n=1 Tax=Hordeum vulgare subsp. vulgare TaxID=112509 RepID=UPI001D1A4123|nr:laminin subunit beta-1 variant-like [Hordeum vulgare subsp. vulgare]